MSNHKKASNGESVAEFVGWQVTVSGEDIRLYNIIDESHPSYGSTVTEQTLRNLNTQIQPSQERNRPE